MKTNKKYTVVSFRTDSEMKKFLSALARANRRTLSLELHSILTDKKNKIEGEKA